MPDIQHPDEQYSEVHPRLQTDRPSDGTVHSSSYAFFGSFSLWDWVVVGEGNEISLMGERALRDWGVGEKKGTLKF